MPDALREETMLILIYFDLIHMQTLISPINP